MAMVLRNSGIPFIDEVNWGSHLCAFYETREDLFETVTGYFTAGIDANEMCVWAMPDEMRSDRGQNRLRDMIPRFDDHAESGRLRFVTAADRYMVAGRFDADRGNVIERLGARNTADAIRRAFGRRRGLH